VGGPKNGHKHLLDSNLDWGQDLKQLKTYMDKKGLKKVDLAYFGHVDPAVYAISYRPVNEHERSGVVAVSANYLYGLPYLITYETPPKSIPPGAFTWLSHRTPDDHVGYSILIFSSQG
jgi:hypothetical protein